MHTLAPHLNGLDKFLLFVALPVGLALRTKRLNPIPLLIVTSLVLLILLLLDPSFDQFDLPCLQALAQFRTRHAEFVVVG